MPSAPGYKRNYKQERLSESPQRKKQRAERNAARAMMMKAGKVHKGDDKEVDHKMPLSKGGSNNKKNLRVRGAAANHSYQRTSSGSMKYKSQK